MSLERLDAETRALLALAGAVALGEEPRLAECCRACVEHGVRTVWVEELLLQSVLMVGWPRALAAFAAWRAVGGAAPGSDDDGGDYSRAEEWRKRGEAVCRTVYGKNYERLRENVRALHPLLDAWMVVEGYGKTLGRPGLDLARRELATALQCAVQGAEPQLHSHLRGARHAGATAVAAGEALELVVPWLGKRQREIAERVWERVREQGAEGRGQ